MSNRCRFDVSITLIRRRENVDKFPHQFDILFQCNFDERKIDVVSTYFVQRNFDKRNMDVVSMYFFWLDFDGRKTNVVSVYFLVRLRWKTDATAHIFMWLWNSNIVVVLIFLFDKFLIYWKLNKPLIKLFKASEKNNSGLLRLNQIMSKALHLKCLIGFWISLW